ncbi:MAG: exodeoxyribonuclease V subunit gamma, partial [Chlamydiota bacterium]
MNTPFDAMSSSSIIYLSNRVEILYDDLVSNLFEASSPFEKRLIIVPSPAMKSWLTLRMAQDPQLQICAGVEIYYLEEGLDFLQNACSDTQRSAHTPSSLEIAIQLEVQLTSILSDYHLLPFDEQVIWKGLADYIQIKPGHHLSKRAEKRLVSLSEKLAHLFKQYGRYGAEMLDEWESNPKDNWQAHLWNRLFTNTELKWTYPYREIKEREIVKGHAPLQLHLFAISYLSALQYTFLQSYSEYYSYRHYLLSPCSIFWSDTRSDKERISIVNSWQKRGLTDQQEKQLEELLRDRNPLLANYGRLGREMLTQIEESYQICEERYVAPDNIKDHVEYSELYFDELDLYPTQDSLSLLQRVQADMLLMRTPKSEELIELAEDASIQVHIAPNKMREIEILYNTLLKVISQHAEEEQPVTPSDIVVLAPDIADYQPYIQAIFGSRESQLDYQLMDLKAPMQSRLIQSFLHLINLPMSNWNAQTIIELFEFPHFHKKHGISIDNIHTIRAWIKESKIFWGTDTEHRDEILNHHHCLRGMVDKSSAGTWEKGFSSLIETTVYREERDSGNLFSRGIEVSITQTEMLGKVIQLTRSLREDLSILYDGSTMCLEEWSDYLLCLLDVYLCEGEDDRESMNLLKKKIEQLGSSGKWVGGSLFTFSTIKKHLLTALEQQHTCYRENHVQAVKFCSMLPMRAIPSRVVSIIGMEEGAFPKQDLDNSLNELRGNEKCDYCPSQVDYDRYLFLEILLSARDHLLMSHSCLTLSEDTEHPPSLVITELLSYLDQNFRVNGHLPSEHSTTHHPYRNFDAAYYTNETLTNYFESSFLAAKSYYQLHKKTPHQFIEDFAAVNTFQSPQGHPIFVDISELINCVRNPLKLFFNKTLGVYLKNSENEQLQTEESFTLTPLDASIIKKSALKYSPEEIMQRAETEGILPMGLFKEVAQERASTDIETIQNILESLGIANEEISSMIFTEECEAPQKDEENRWMFPPIELQHSEQTIVITGTLHNVSRK